MLFVLGQVYDRELKDLTRAIETYQTILDLDPEDVTAIQALDRLYQQAGRWYDLLQILEREVELSSSSGETVSLKHRIGVLWERELKDLGRAVEAYRDVLRLDGGHEPTLVALDGLVHGDAEPVLAAQVLEPIFEANGEWEKLIDVLDVMVRHTDDPVRRVELLHRIADYYERALESHADAFKAYGQALREDSSNEVTLGHLERLADQIKGWDELAGLYESELGKLLEVPRQVDMLLRVARVYEEELGKTEKAIATYPPRRRGRGREQRGDPGARSALSADRALERSGRRLAPRDSAGAERRRDRRAAVPARAAVRAEPARHRLGDRRLRRDPGRTAAMRRRWRRSSCSLPRASSRSRSRASWSRCIGSPSSGSARQDLRSAAGEAEPRRRAHAAHPEDRRDARAAARRSAERVHLVGAGGA
jgi:tetratricopeptide (TPR) repeat protein